ncbi:hypothetical protein NMV76_22845 [Escherichia coli]|uniref:hypothetical protein n=1 Tax=Escherichia coli TaxID=562 RepID=UPI0022465279|nr:hypothetical protein [Escherichia coli]MCX0188882.1 hypothetical protein [Escherichia coli]
MFSHPVYLFLREFSLQDSRGGSDFIQSVEFNEPRMMLPIIDSNMKRLVIEQTNKYSISPEQFLKGAVTILYSDNILVTDSVRVH